MDNATKVSDWCKFYSSAPDGYRPHALKSCLDSDGEKMLAQVVQKLGIETTVNAVKDW